MKTIEERWLGFRARCVPPEATPQQVENFRLVFYAGVQSMLDATLYLATLDDRQAFDLLDAMFGEMYRFRISAGTKQTG
jgi:hypothetical protein